MREEEAMGNEKSGNKKNRVVFFYENDTELFKEAWEKLYGSNFDEWERLTKQTFNAADAQADKIRIEKAEAENAKGLDFPPEKKAEAKAESEKPGRFTEICNEMGITAEWARSHGAPRFKFGKAYYTLRSRMEQWQRSLAESRK